MASRGDELMGLVLVGCSTGLVWFAIGFGLGWWLG
jgi:hypothetical protein